jgi:glutathione S-transferase
MKPILYVGNRNYSSWSLRPWLALRWSALDFDTHVVQLGGPGYGERSIAEVLAISPSGTVPTLHVGADVIPDSLAICEWAAERVPQLWPADATARAYARSAVCEMHSGFAAIRENLPCNIRRRSAAREWAPAVLRELARVEALWTGLRERFGARHGDTAPYLLGRRSIADAFFTPVATRFRTYNVQLGPVAQAYVQALLRDDAFLEWEAEAEREPWKMAAADEH